MARVTSQAQQLASHSRAASPAIELTPEAQAVLQLWEHTRQHVFFTGRAGTGKSTLRQHFRATTRRRLVVLAPTGVAAVNVHGQTIHAFFGFGPDITPEKARRRALRKRQLYATCRHSSLMKSAWSVPISSTVLTSFYVSMAPALAHPSVVCNCSSLETSINRHR